MPACALDLTVPPQRIWREGVSRPMNGMSIASSCYHLPPTLEREPRPRRLAYNLAWPKIAKVGSFLGETTRICQRVTAYKTPASDRLKMEVFSWDSQPMMGSG